MDPFWQDVLALTVVGAVVAGNVAVRWRRRRRQHVGCPGCVAQPARPAGRLVQLGGGRPSPVGERNGGRPA